MVTPPHPVVLTTLQKLRQLLADAVEQLPDTDGDPLLDAVQRASLVGALIAGLRASYSKATAATAATVSLATYNTFEEHPEILVELDQMCAVGPGPLPRCSSLDLSKVQEGIAAGVTALRSLPDSDGESRVVLSQQVGAIAGLLLGLIDLGGFDATVYDAIETARRAAKSLQDTQQAAYLSTKVPIDPSSAN